jgi:hypothetical protein
VVPGYDEPDHVELDTGEPVTLTLTRGQLGLIESILRMDIRKRVRNRVKIEPHPGQDPADFERFAASLDRALTFRYDLYDEVRRYVSARAPLDEARPHKEHSR